MNQEFLLEVAKEAAEASRIKRHPEYPPVEEYIAGKSIEEALEMLDSKYHNVSSVREAVRFIEDYGLFENAGNIKDNKEEIAKMIIGAGVYIHDNWIKENFDKKFFDPERVNKKFQFAPSGMIGYNEFAYDLKYVKMAFKKLGLECDENAIKKAYIKHLLITDGEISKYNEETIAMVKSKLVEVGLHIDNIDDVAKSVYQSLGGKTSILETFPETFKDRLGEKFLAKNEPNKDIPGRGED